MASQQIDAALYSPDVLEFISCLNSCLNQAKVKYLIVGGEAVIFHGYPRFTEDVDFYFANDPENLNQMMVALNEFWDHNIPEINAVEYLADEK